MKKLIPRFNRFDKAFFIGVTLWVAETAYFGWNASPESTTEQLLDIVAGGVMFYGAVGTLVLAAVKTAIYEIAVEKYLRKNDTDD